MESALCRLVPKAAEQASVYGEMFKVKIQEQTTGDGLKFSIFFPAKNATHFRLFLGFVLSNCNIINKDGKTPFYKYPIMNQDFMLHVTGGLCVAIPSPVFCGQVISLLEAESLETSAAEAVPGAR